MSNVLWKLKILGYFLQNAWTMWKQEVWRKDPDSTYCCDGHECGCHGASVREINDPKYWRFK